MALIDNDFWICSTGEIAQRREDMALIESDTQLEVTTVALGQFLETRDYLEASIQALSRQVKRIFATPNRPGLTLMKSAVSLKEVELSAVNSEIEILVGQIEEYHK